MAFTTWTDGQVLTHTELNANMLPSKIAELYTGTGFDCSRTTSGTTTNNITLSLTSGELDNATYLIVKISYLASLSTDAANGAVSLRVERAQSGGAFSDILGTTIIAQANNSGDYGITLATIELPVTLTAGEKSSGIDVKITGTVEVDGNVSVALIANKGVVLQTSY